MVTADRERSGSPEGKIFGAVDPAAVETVTAALTAAGFPAAQIDVLTADDLDDVEKPLERPGLGGLVSRFLASMGDDLDEHEKAHQELAAGYVLVGVTAASDDAVQRVRDILREHGAHGITHYGRWTITTFD